MLYIIVLVAVLGFSWWWVRSGHRRWMRASETWGENYSRELDSLGPWRRKRKAALTLVPTALLGSGTVGAYLHGTARAIFFGIFFGVLGLLLLLNLTEFWDDFSDWRRRRR